MLQILEQTENNIIATKASGKLTEVDYKKLLPLLKNALDKHSKIRWYFEMVDFEGWELKAFWEDVKFDAKHANDFDKVAMVGEKMWEEKMSDLMGFFSSAKVKYFDISDKEAALKWIKK
ncbi:STAS/SEC14 domain-containing protein [Algoriphagus yeomjeoni]|uniref:STAS/SEC14 domain-containing protein n=1 Tax=Algoriphagus TaxID=246875 RepID=UPI0030D82CE8|tara:strand:- start:18907 stop:19263 length:357 start_codon:yes stop_codon:yes gene_type:complete